MALMLLAQSPRARLPNIFPLSYVLLRGKKTDKIWGMRQGAKGYLVKPIKAAELLQKITELG